MENVYRLRMAGRELRYKFWYPGTCHQFKNFIISSDEDGYDLETAAEDVEYWKRRAPEEALEEFLEKRLMVLKISHYLIGSNACVIHACSVVWKGLAWLFTGTSGTGKTTLYRNWKKLLKDDVQILCGDMPFTVVLQDGSVCVYPSPWNGKECYGSMLEAPLGGILYLSQGSENYMTRLAAAEAAAPLYTQFMCVSDTEETVGRLAYIEESILRTVPVWHFVNKGDSYSAVVSTKAITEYLKETRL